MRVKRIMILKNIFDFIVSIIALIFLSPILVSISLAIFLESGFPIVHRRKVHRSPSKTFYFYKFRTMYKNADDRLKILLKNNPDIKLEYEKYYKLKNDPRITKLGYILRNLSLDELPQFFNILFFQMSLVGPRPKTSYELNKYFEKEDHETLFQVKPGITCIWQIAGRSNVDYLERVKMDLYYAQNRNFFMDLKILFQTPFALLKKDAF
jgi:undecaprenyl-phosphate galactose phosphotransferase